MVEGPGCKVKGEKLRGKIRLLKVLRLKGTALLHGKAKSKVDQPVSKFDVILGETITDVKTLGKELFIFFHEKEFCLRMHFLMDGGFRINGKKVDSEMGGEAIKPTLLLFLSSGDQLAFNKSAADIRDAASSLARIELLLPLDICYEHFSHKMAVAKCMEQAGERLVCDVLLDQTVFPGVGNIIKNEALFDCSMMPDCTMSMLTEAHISHLVKMTRDFSIIFYKCRRDGKPLWPYMKLYNKEKCKQCGGHVIKTKMGEDSARLTWFCSTCMSKDPAKIRRNLPAKNSLLNWVKSSEIASTADFKHEHKVDHTWTCATCTLINTASRNTCKVCFTDRDPNKTNVHESVGNCEPSKHQASSFHKGYTSSRPENVKEENRNILPEFPSLTMPESQSVFKRKLPLEENDDEAVQQPPVKVGRFTFKKSSALESSLISEHKNNSFTFHQEIYEKSSEKNLVNKSSNFQSANQVNILPTQSRTFNGGCSKFDTNSKEIMKNDSNNSKAAVKNEATPAAIMVVKARTFVSSSKVPPTPSSKSKKLVAPYCSQHKVECKMRQVHKEGNNYHRVFWCCPARTRCNFFKWADENFPICEGHGKRAVLRTVLKQGANNGRKFFACPLSKSKQCSFFQWVDDA